MGSLVPFFIFFFVFHTFLPMLIFYQGISIYQGYIAKQVDLVYMVTRGYKQKRASSAAAFVSSDQRQIYGGCLALYCPLKWYSSMVVSRQHTQISSLTRFNFIHFYVNSLFFLLQPGGVGELLQPPRYTAERQ